ncbi:MAG: tyrosine recombinase XerC [Clostridia bacterium]|nr:tyrosine recombinase XerC [Clostridia bacterium]
MPNLDFSDAPSLVVDFLDNMLLYKGRSANTVFQYYHDLRSFFRFLLIKRKPKEFGDYLPGDLSFSEIDDKMVLSVKTTEIIEFLRYCSNDKSNEVAARNRKLSAIRSFYKYLTKNKMKLEKNPAENIEGAKLPKRLPKFLNIDESKELLESVKGANYERDYAIITLFLNLGLRVSELCGINLKDISKDFETLRVVGKGNKERMVYLNDACESAIKAYLNVRPKNARPEAESALFISRNRNRISKQTVQWLIYKHLDEAGLARPGMSVHKLRHTAATLMYQHGHTDVRVLKDILGHEDISTTEIYTHISNEQLRDATRANPLAGIKPSKKQKSLSDVTDSDDEE